jgi:hypothetical protein
MWLAARWLIAREVIAIDDLKWITDLAKLATLLIVRDMTMGVEGTFASDM